jgi:hypothetical protein
MHLRKLLLVCVLGAVVSPRLLPRRHFTREQLRADLVELKRALNDMPPDLYRRRVANSSNASSRTIESAIDKSPPARSRCRMALVRDAESHPCGGHLFVGFVDWRGDARAYLANGGRLFPFEVSVSSGCELAVRNDKPWSNVMMPHESPASSR